MLPSSGIISLVSKTNTTVNSQELANMWPMPTQCLTLTKSYGNTDMITSVQEVNAY